MDHDEYIKRVRSYIKTPTKDLERQLDDFCGLCSYVSGQYDRDDSFQNLESHLKEIEKGRKEAHRLFYMALPPSVFTIVSQHLKKCCYPTKGIARVIVSCPNTNSQKSLTRRCRSRSHSGRILVALESCRSHWSPTGPRTSSSVLTTTLERRW